jgi:hypothetical protein
MKRLIAMVLAIGLMNCAVARAEGPLDSIYDTRRSSHSTYEWTFSSDVEFMTGRLGTAFTTYGLYVPFTLQRNLPHSRIGLTVPYIGERTAPDVADREGRLSQVNKTGSTSYTDSGGLSDLILKWGYDFKRELDGDTYDLSGVANVKFPTASRSRGLGTGEADETVGVEASRMLEYNWFVMGGMYYTNTGDQPSNKLNNPFGFSMGIGYQWPEAQSISVSYEDSGALADDRPRSRDFLFNITHPLNEDTDIVGNILWGLSEGSEDFGIGIGTNIRF